MTQPILHHYGASLFSEKVRLLLGWKGIAWQSVEISPVMPRPLLMPLSGGYRRTPILQHGADVYCDTRVIAQMLDELAPEPPLFPAARRFAANGLAEWAETHLFRVTVALNFSGEAAAAAFGRMPKEVQETFVRDRAELSAGSQGIGQIAPEVALAWCRQHLADLEAQCAAGPDFLHGDQPDIADFAVYHCLWFLKQNPVNVTLLDGHPALLAWMERMAAPGHGDVTPMSAEAALAVGRDASPADPRGAEGGLPEGLALGDAVAVAATDYGVKPIHGTLVDCGLDRLAIRREDPEAGAVHVHFPRLGFSVSPA